MTISAAQFGALAGQMNNPAIGGFTVDPHTGSQPTSGYMVAIKGHEERLPATSGGSDIADYHARHAAAWSTPGAHLGGWADSASGTHVYDTAEKFPGHVGGLHRAGAAMIKRGEDAMWHLDSGSEVRNPIKTRYRDSL